MFKQWVSYMSHWVVRADNLNKKYEAMSEIGFGGQAKVYKVLRRDPNIRQAAANHQAPGGSR